MEAGRLLFKTFLTSPMVEAPWTDQRHVPDLVFSNSGYARNDTKATLRDYEEFRLWATLLLQEGMKYSPTSFLGKGRMRKK
jgi:hypothetical protein